MPLTQGQQVDQGNPGVLPWPVNVNGPVSVTTQPSPAATLTTVPASATSVTVLAANVNRTGASIFNASSKTLFLAAAASATSTAFTVQIAANGYFEVPFGYTGILSGLWAAANGNAMVTEYT